MKLRHLTLAATLALTGAGLTGTGAIAAPAPARPGPTCPVAVGSAFRAARNFLVAARVIAAAEHRVSATAVAIGPWMAADAHAFSTAHRNDVVRRLAATDAWIKLSPGMKRFLSDTILPDGLLDLYNAYGVLVASTGALTVSYLPELGRLAVSIWWYGEKAGDLMDSLDNQMVTVTQSLNGMTCLPAVRAKVDQFARIVHALAGQVGLDVQRAYDALSDFA